MPFSRSPWRIWPPSRRFVWPDFELAPHVEMLASKLDAVEREKRSLDDRRPWGRALITGLVPAATVFL
jgi:hypothetical protein